MPGQPKKCEVDFRACEMANFKGGMQAEFILYSNFTALV